MAAKPFPEDPVNYVPTPKIVSNGFVRDAGYIVQVDNSLLGPARMTGKIVQGMTYAACIKQGVIPASNVDDSLLVTYKLSWIHSSGGPNSYMEFSPITTPSASLAPSNQFSTRDRYYWPPVLRNLTIRHIKNGQNYISSSADYFVSPAYKDLSTVIVRQWWTDTPWPEELLISEEAQVGPVQWSFIGTSENLNVLHDDIVIPSLNGLYQNAKISKKSILYPATNFITWVPTVIYDDVKLINGRYFREQHEVQPPYDPLVYPEAPRTV